MVGGTWWRQLPIPLPADPDQRGGGISILVVHNLIILHLYHAFLLKRVDDNTLGCIAAVVRKKDA